MKYYVIIVAGGTGSRMGGDLPKQFIVVAGKPVIVHTINQFINFRGDLNFIISIHPGMRIQLQEILVEYFPSLSFTLVNGGETRFHSVKNGLEVISTDNAVVGIHDAARPLVSISTIERCFKEAKSNGNACPVIDISESLRQITESGSKMVDRSDFRIVQTPQCFQVKRIKEAFGQNFSKQFTDDASVLESFGTKINLVEGNKENIKITYPGDLLFAEALLRQKD